VYVLILEELEVIVQVFDVTWDTASWDPVHGCTFMLGGCMYTYCNVSPYAEIKECPINAVGPT